MQTESRPAGEAITRRALTAEIRKSLEDGDVERFGILANQVPIVAVSEAKRRVRRAREDVDARQSGLDELSSDVGPEVLAEVDDAMLELARAQAAADRASSGSWQEASGRLNHATRRADEAQERMRAPGIRKERARAHVHRAKDGLAAAEAALEALLDRLVAETMAMGSEA